MRTNAYAIFDRASGSYSNPFFLPSDASARRSFGDSANNKELNVGAHPEDYTLFRIGRYDDQTAELAPESPEKICGAWELLPALDDGQLMHPDDITQVNDKD